MAWFSLTGSDPTNPNDYTNVGGSAPSTCDGIEQICAIQADPDGNNKPTFTSALLADMVEALHFQTPSDTVKLKDRPVR